jgi:hypothetical protein
MEWKMIIDKITTGFVIQRFNTDSQEFFSQEFIGGDEVAYEVDGSPINVVNFEDRLVGKVPYLPFEMKQPDEMVEGRDCYACLEPIKHSGKFCMSCGAEQKMT